MSKAAAEKGLHDVYEKRHPDIAALVLEGSDPPETYAQAVSDGLRSCWFGWRSMYDIEDQGLTCLPSFDFLYRSYLASGDERFLQVAHDLIGSIRPTTNSRLFNAFVKKVRRLSEGEAARLQRG